MGKDSRTFALSVPAEVTAALYAFATATLIVLVLGALFQALDLEPLGGLFANHLKESALLAGAVFSAMGGFLHYAGKWLERVAKQPAMELASELGPKLDAMNNRLTEMNTRQERSTTALQQMAQRGLQWGSDVERIKGYLEGQAGARLGALDKEDQV